MNAERYLSAAQYVAWAIPRILAERGLKPFISRIVLTETQQGNAWLFTVLEVSPADHPEDYAAPDLLQYLSTALKGLPVVVSESYGLRYAVLLGSPDLFDET
jgi:transposase InsO family protein